MINCIATDMDGTLLTASQQITAENREAILKAQKQGVEVVVATGRSYQEARFVLKEAGIKCPIICVNGAEVRTAEGDIVTSNPLDKESASQTALRLVENGVYFEVYTNKGTYTDDKDKSITIIADIIKTANPEAPIDMVVKAAEERFHKGLIHLIDHYDLLFKDDQYQIYKILAFSLHVDKLDAARAAVEEIGGIAVSSSGADNLEITDKSAQKGIALEAFVASKGISINNTMAIGDNYNDVSMFKRVGRSVAMENAPEEIKGMCDVVTVTNEESGVAKAILEVL
ncbi:Cof-type HAD-IIB family hydrolase [Bacillus sp. T33-2]|uniref:Cof-type HAD-IIB family hydrolase n=1 Tax=Bacillus sp. T33-2 TaxID=2054168 RepID=UPI000C7814A7|nr:Cof-type HAD-IIB family hydrolase [Bacillus sp. T33-2]PLR96551.1 Cof-type HAD-IIB family hydrolase [Bacillus sp. T33-2]